MTRLLVLVLLLGLSGCLSHKEVVVETEFIRCPAKLPRYSPVPMPKAPRTPRQFYQAWFDAEAAVSTREAWIRSVRRLHDACG